MATTRKASSTNGTTDLRQLLETLRTYGVTRYRAGDVEVELGAVQPARELEDFATVGLEEEAEDARFDHVGMRPRREEADA